MTKDADPRRLYHNILVAIDPTRHLNNGHPSFLAFLLDELELQAGDRAVHVGCGTGYYTAVMAEIVGPEGHVMAMLLPSKLTMNSPAAHGAIYVTYRMFGCSKVTAVK